MKTKKIIVHTFLLSAVLVISVLLVGINDASALVTFSQNTTLSLDVGNVTIESGSEVDEVTSTNSNISISMSAGQTIVLLSSQRRHLSNSLGLGFTCDASQSRLSITAAASQTVVVSPSSTTCDSSGGGGGGSVGGGSVAATPTPTPSPDSSPAPTPSVSPTPTLSSTPVPTSESKPTPSSRGFVSLKSVSLNEGDVISAPSSNDPDVYIVNPYGYKRLFLNPAIFNFYGHLGFNKVKTTTSITRDVFVTSGLFRNCEANDKKVYGVEINGEDSGVLHWVDTTGEKAVADDPDFFKKVFCINTKEFNWYPRGSSYTSVNQIPDYSRK